MEWIFYYLISYPAVYKKLLAEIDQVFDDTEPSLDDWKKTPYAEAFTEEIMRHCPLTFFVIPHYSTQDSMLGSHACPKGTTVGSP